MTARDDRYKILFQLYGGYLFVGGAFAVLFGLFMARDADFRLLGLPVALYGGYRAIVGFSVLARWWIGWVLLMLSQVLEVIFQWLAVAGVAIEVLARLQPETAPPSLGWAMISSGISVAMLIFIMNRRPYFDR